MTYSITAIWFQIGIRVVTLIILTVALIHIVFIIIKNNRKPSFPQSYRILIFFLLSIAFAIALYINNAIFKKRYGIESYKVRADAMAPTLTQGSCFLVDHKMRNYEDIQWGDIIIFTQPNTEEKIEYTKRVVGTEGMKISFIEGVLHTNGIPVHEEYISSTSFTNTIEEIDVPNKSLYLLGDNRSSSYDSRYYGCIPEKNIRGKMLYILWSKEMKNVGKVLSPSYEHGLLR